MPAPVVLSVRNTPADGLRLAVTLQGAPTGTPTFYASQTPATAGGAGTGVIAQSGSGTAWTVTVEAQAAVIREGWYVAVRDDNGLSNEEAEWLCAVTNVDIENQTEAALQTLLAANRKLLHRSLQAYQGDTWPDGTPAEILKVLRGYPVPAPDLNPIVYVRVPSFAEDLGLTSYTDIATLNAALYTAVFHQDKDRSAEAVVRAVGKGVFNVLNQRANLRLNLACGLQLTAAHCSDFVTDEEYREDFGGYMAVAEMQWTANLYLGK